MNAVAGPVGRLLPPLFEPPAARAPFACRPVTSRGRLFAEPESATRTCYQRDRDRIIHSTAFRRLKHKTQVFVQDEGDYFRTRLTHSLEVAQIARSIARLLAVDEDLAEALSLSHDLGHTPFGHAGEEALNHATRDIGGFDHNAHALRLVTRLEHRYASFDGLNLTWETLEGLVKHNGPLVDRPAPARVPAPVATFDARWALDLSSWPGVEAQLSALADDIAYVNHDLDDALRAGLFSVDDLASAPLAGPVARRVLDRYGRLELGRFIGEVVHHLIGNLIDDMITETCGRLAAASPDSPAAVRALGKPVVAFSPPMAGDLSQLKDFLFARMYRHPRVVSSMSAAKNIVRDLFTAYTADPALLPQDWRESCRGRDHARTAGVVRDYIAGMTDRFALLEHRRIFHTQVTI
ncbi:MAG TPA: deoxyguanosinetriphosphate triphosphohydrolase [Rhizomicrobium sp.]|nr:deoxyguanosinetriphosphate triphosphohydrolase [Rhizomicrobium sp.]